MSLESLRIRVLDGENEGSLRSPAEITNFAHEVIEPELKNSDVVLVPKGVIDPNVLHSKIFQGVPVDPTTAIFHIHDTVHIVPTAPTSVGTLVSPHRDCAQGLSEVLSDPQSFLQLFKLGSAELLGFTRDSLQRVLEESSLTEDSLNDSFVNFQACFYRVRAPEKLQILYERLQRVQELIRNKGRSLLIDWNQYALGTVKGGVYHARDLSVQNVRNETETLRYFGSDA